LRRSRYGVGRRDDPAASTLLRQFEAVTRIETLQLQRMLKRVASEGEVRLAVRPLKSWLKKRDLLLEVK